ncbi:MAG: NADPH-dependent FMN reductase [Bdellovibrionales bacterium]
MKRKPKMPKLIFFAGSARKESFNKKLAKAASEKAKSLGATVTYIDLADYPMPILCEDLESEHGLPDAAKTLKKLFIDHDGFLVACPEYNSSYTPLLKNTLDWMSRPGDDGTNCFAGKVSAIMAASPGGLGGMRMLPQLRLYLSHIAMHGTSVIPKQFSLPHAGDALNDNGKLIGDHPMFDACVDQFVETAKLLKKQ